MTKQFSNVVLTTENFSSALGKDWHSVVPQPYFDPLTVVTRNTSGEPLSHYGDDRWDFRAQSKDASSPQTIYLYQAPEIKVDQALFGRIYEQHKALLWITTDRGGIKTFGTLSSYNSVAKVWCKIAYEKAVDLFTLLTDFEEVVAACNEMNSNELTATTALIQYLWKYRKELLPEGAQMQREKIIENIKAARLKLPEKRQTPLIPSQIYCTILGGLISGLDTIEHDINSLLIALRKSTESTAVFKKKYPDATAQKIATVRGKALAETVECMRLLGWVEGSGKTLHNFILGKITAYQIHLMHTVVAFSGMRVGEAHILPLNEISEAFQHRGQTHYLIKGYTHKLHRGVKTAAEWITIDQGQRAIEIAIRIGQTILALHGKKPQKKQEPLLFPSISNPFKMITVMAFSTGQKRLISAICPEITAEDIEELNQLDLARSWDRDGIEIGKRWPLAMHQLRRSLSVYAHRSGMVTLPALKAQLQHITDEMRMYYADGWSRAVNLVFERDHFSHEWNAAKTESTYFGLMGALQIAFDGQDVLFGLGAQRMAQVISGRSREQTIALIKNGTIAYRETVLGGCVNTQECKTMPLDPINFECLESNCVNIVVHSKRLEMVIRTQENVVAQLVRDESGSVEQRLEAEHLKRMLRARDLLINSKIEKKSQA